MFAARVLLTRAWLLISFASGRCGLLPYQAQGGFVGLGAELACGTCAFDQAAPPFVSAVLIGDLAPAGKRAVTGPVGQRPLPRLPLKPPACTSPGWTLPKGRPAWAARPTSALRPYR